MKLFLNIGGDPSAEKLTFAAQIGVDGVVAMPAPAQPDVGYYDAETLTALRLHIESFGLEFFGIRLLPWIWTYKWQLGLPGRDEQLEHLATTVRNIGAAGIPMLVYNMHALRFYRTTSTLSGRGGAAATGFDFDEVRDLPLMTGGPGIDSSLIPPSHRRPVDDDDMWENLAYLLKAIVPVAEAADVRLALHPDDPPVPSIGGVARIMREGFPLCNRLIREIHQLCCRADAEVTKIPGNFAARRTESAGHDQETPRSYLPRQMRISEQSYHPFRSKVTTDFGAKLPPVSV